MKTACTITLILHFEVHLDLKSQPAVSKCCPVIKQAISAGLRKANTVLGYSNSTFALLCPCENGDPHSATFGDGCWICSLNEGVSDELTPNQLLWLAEEASAGK